MTEITDLATIEKDLLDNLPKQYDSMLDIVRGGQPEIERATLMFNKTQSQFMDNMMTVSYLTPIRNLRQILAEMKVTKQALGEAHYKIARQKIRIEKLQRQIDAATDDLDRRELELKKEEIEYGIAVTMDYVGGAIRKMTNYTLQYQQILNEHHLENFDEFDFEEEEEKYHICRAFQQALCAARAHGGYIDEGNQIYFEQIGINGTVAQIEMNKYLNTEYYLLADKDAEGNQKQPIEPPHEMQVEWILSMAEKFKGCSSRYAAWKGMRGTQSDEALVHSPEE